MPKAKVASQLPLEPAEIIEDYRRAYRSRQASIVGRREVLSGKAKFGIFGGGKEVVNIVLARVFQKGDWRSGYYRDHAWMEALAVANIQQIFSQLYTHLDVEADPSSAGRQMNGHFASRFIGPDGQWLDQTRLFNSAADVSPTGTQMPRSVGLAYASVLYRKLSSLKQFTQFSNSGNEVTFATIGNASTAEGMFWESVNAIGVLQAPAVISVYDDGYGISVPNQFQMVKESIYTALEGFRRDDCADPDCARGFNLYQVKGWDYPAMLKTYGEAADAARKDHIPALVHVTELTQPQGHSTSGSHERYKSAERLQWEAEWDCLVKMREWVIASGVLAESKLAALEAEDNELVENFRREAWDAYLAPMISERATLMDLLDEIATTSSHAEELRSIRAGLEGLQAPIRRDMQSAAHKALRVLADDPHPSKTLLAQWRQNAYQENQSRYESSLHTGRALQVPEVKPAYSDDSPTLMGFEVVNAGFDAIFARDPRVIAFGEDVGVLGDVNQGFKGMQEKYGNLRVTDTGIREATILGQAIGMAMRGLRPICEIQYLDYVLYALQIMADDLANLHWRTAGGQIAPVIVRSRGHRLEGIWHSGSPMAGILNLIRGVYLLVPRDMTRAAGFYNTLLHADEPAVIVEVLNAYRLKERLPDNIGQVTVPLGVPEVLREGKDITVVTYGACCRIALSAAEMLEASGVQAEVIDVQSLLPFDIHGRIGQSIAKTSRVIFVDEDVPGGATAYMLQQVLEKQGAYFKLDSPPRTLTGSEHRPSAGSDGDYWSKPNAELIFDTAYSMMHESDPSLFPSLTEG